MDFTAIGSLTTAINAAKDIARATVGLRDFNLVAESVTRLNEQLLKAQDGLLAHNAQLFQLQEENFKAREELRKLKEALNERTRYALVNLGQDQFAYRVKLTPAPGTTSDPISTEPLHYLCQACFDQGRKAVLQASTVWGSKTWTCPVCKIELTMQPA